MTEATTGWKGAGLVLLALAVGAGGLAITQDDCRVACGTEADQAFRQAMGFAALALGAMGAVLAWVGRPRPALVSLLVGGACCAAAVLEGISHLS